MKGLKQSCSHRRGWFGGKLFRAPDEPSSVGACCPPPGEDGASVRICSLHGNDGMRSRLCSLGFTPGTEITVYAGGENGCRVRVRGTCVALDADSAGNILCDTGSGVATVQALCGKGQLE